MKALAEVIKAYLGARAVAFAAREKWDADMRSGSACDLADGNFEASFRSAQRMVEACADALKELLTRLHHIFSIEEDIEKLRLVDDGAFDLYSEMRDAAIRLDLVHLTGQKVPSGFEELLEAWYEAHCLQERLFSMLTAARELGADGVEPKVAAHINPLRETVEAAIAQMKADFPDDEELLETSTDRRNRLDLEFWLRTEAIYREAFARTTEGGEEDNRVEDAVQLALRWVGSSCERLEKPLRDRLADFHAHGVYQQQFWALPEELQPAMTCADRVLSTAQLKLQRQAKHNPLRPSVRTTPVEEEIASDVEAAIYALELQAIHQDQEEEA